MEFADYRDYSVGDDFRRVDWNVYARLERLFLKLFVEEEDLHVYILLDSSKSMDFGNPTKLLYGKRIAAALSYIALCNFDRVGMTAMSNGTAATLQPKRGKGSALSIFRYLESVHSSGFTRMSDSIRDFSLRTSQPGLVIVISDFFDPESCDALNALLARKFEVMVIHLLDQEEVEPSMIGDVMLIDSENGGRREVTVSPSLLKRYKQRFAQFCSKIEEYCARHGCSYIRVTNETPFEELMLSYLRERGAVK